MISTRGRYAIRFMIDLAEQPDGTLVPLGDTAKRQGISKKYLEIVVKQLVAAGMVKGVSGKGGGYCLLREPHEYTALEVLQTTEGSLAPVACLRDGAEECPRRDHCQTLPMWTKFDSLVNDFFEGITIADLAEGRV
ncbi:MAG: Rrf2 family transcriptional regulator [Coriobacteriaceae bacterium]|nr:Rrf2 family transcriptional regulator [Coriobacteriaceae bacterium]MDY3799892.1 Rrf2 family transcriptional regulator [Eggerthellaceae bacterium]MDD6635885.1 Rrf2 family transcriptional regulator [Coriobacteriaceae bacterium]MDD7431200.1 Rrf2 family transcriptional regulator [Coriobacteriaceae bacterium]MDO4498234.1 Rrf2 family transcriptional regulator [Coriobacteriaceae bacterium]